MELDGSEYDESTSEESVIAEVPEVPEAPPAPETAVEKPPAKPRNIFSLFAIPPRFAGLSDVPLAIEEALSVAPKCVLTPLEGADYVTISGYRVLLVPQERQERPAYEKDRPWLTPEEQGIAPPPPPPRLSTLCRTSLVIACVGGAFSGGFFEKERPGVHTSFKHYVNRQKQGGRQMTHDKKARPKSIGSEIRRWNEEAHQEKIRQTLTEWAPRIAQCDVVFLCAPGENRRILYFEGSPLHAHPRVRNVPFTCHKAIYREVQRIHQLVTQVQIDRPDE
ncbi:hypothetical protein PAPYR_9063 [Paratrimastix pyriformis]|uniref:VLRF1 domain-containing protein n=1 Tax=Paratrimastix pyriformis TaxID=342808 RepID=A0ABQ8UBW7_9EUKA|nr:hypothetical protein PAPYR_9063 [Paratrimastix pyriformis]